MNLNGSAWIPLHLASLRHKHPKLNNNPLLTCMYGLLRHENILLNQWDQPQILCTIVELLHEVLPIVQNKLSYEEVTPDFIKLLYAQLPLSDHDITIHQLKHIYVELEMLKENDSLHQLMRDDIPRSVSDNDLECTVDGAIIILNVITACNEFCSSILAELSTIILIAIAKRGHDSGYCYRMVLNEIKEPHVFSCDAVIMVWNHIKSKIDHDNVRDIIRHFNKWIPKGAPFLQMTICNIEWMGLVPLITIREAYITFPLFAWRQVENMFPEEVNRLKTLYKIISKNPFYGYSNDERIEKSNFSNMSYVAKQVLLSMDSEKKIPRSTPIVDKPLNYNVIDKLISEEKMKMLQIKIYKTLPITNSILLPIVWKCNTT